MSADESEPIFSRTDPCSNCGSRDLYFGEKGGLRYNSAGKAIGAANQKLAICRACNHHQAIHNQEEDKFGTWVDPNTPMAKRYRMPTNEERAMDEVMKPVLEERSKQDAAAREAILIGKAEESERSRASTGQGRYDAMRAAILGVKQCASCGAPVLKTESYKKVLDRSGQNAEIHSRCSLPMGFYNVSTNEEKPEDEG